MLRGEQGEEVELSLVNVRDFVPRVEIENLLKHEFAFLEHQGMGLESKCHLQNEEF